MQTKQLPDQDATAVNALLRAIDPFFQMSGVISARSVQAFLLVASNEGAPVQEYARKAQMSASTMSRNLLDIGDRNRRGQPGYGLVAGRDNLENRRLKEYHLTDKGRSLIRKIGKQFATKGE